MKTIKTLIEILYSNTGKALKTLAIIVSFIVEIACIIYSIILLFEGEGIFFLILIASPVISYLSALVLYAFGELVENTKKIAENTASLQNQNTSIKEEKLLESQK